MKFKFSFLVALSAALVAGCAAYYSVFGLSQLFAGAGTAVIIMASSLEFSKIIAVSFLHRYWKKISTGLKTYLTIGVFILICITSAGIYGFLSNAYQKTANRLEVNEGQLSVLTGKKELFQKNIDDNQKTIDTKNGRVVQLSNLRTTQESRLDAATTNSARSKARDDIATANKEIDKLNLDIDGLTAKNTQLLDSVNTYSNKTIESKSNNDVAGEVGPLKYLAQLTGYPMDKVVNWFILLLIFVFDPLAVSLVIATNKVMELEKNGYVEPPIEPKPKKDRKWLKSIGDSFKNSVKNVSNKVKPVFEAKAPSVTVTEESVKPSRREQVVEVIEKVEPTPNPDTNRGFSMNIPTSNNTIERIGSNKVVKDGNSDKLIFKRRS